MKKLTRQLVTALYTAALKVLDSETYTRQSDPLNCGMALAAKLLGVERMQRSFFRQYMSEEEFESVWYFMGDRAGTASRLRDLADKLTIRLRAKSKMNVKALLAAAREIENNPEGYSQCDNKFGILGRVAAAAGLAPFESDGLGLTPRQNSKLRWFMATWDATGERFKHDHLGDNPKYYGSVHYKAINDLPADKRAKVAAAAIRRMAIYGN